MPTEQLVDELYGDEPPKTATASLQNSVVALRKALGPDVLVTRPPGYVLAVSADQIDARRFEQLLGDARQRSAGGAPRAARPRARALARPAARRVRVRRLGAGGDPPARRAAARRGRGADRDRRRARPPGRRRPASSRRSSASMPLRERPARAADARALSGRSPGGGARARTDARARRARRDRHRAGREASAPTGRDPPPRGRPHPGPERRRAATPTAEIVKAILAGRVVPVLGLDGATDLAARARGGRSGTRASARSTSRASRSTSRP